MRWDFCASQSFCSEEHIRYPLFRIPIRPPPQRQHSSMVAYHTSGNHRLHSQLSHTHTQQETLFDGNSIRAIAKHGPKTANKSSSLFVYITNCEKPYLQRLYSPSISDRAVALLLCVVTATLFHFVLAAYLLPASLPFMFYYVLVLAKENFNLMVLPMSLLEWQLWGWRMSTAGNEYTVRLSNWR